MKIFKKFFIFYCFICFLGQYCFANEIDSKKVPITNSKHIIVIDRKTLSVLYEKDGYSKTAMASTTKIMTCILAIENIDLNKYIRVSKNACSVHGSVLGLKENDSITVYNLLYGLMLKSRK